MALIFKRRIEDGRMTIDEVPPKWREEVERLLNE